MALAAHVCTLKDCVLCSRHTRTSRGRVIRGTVESAASPPSYREMDFQFPVLSASYLADIRMWIVHGERHGSATFNSVLDQVSGQE